MDQKDPLGHPYLLNKLNSRVLPSRWQVLEIIAK